MNQQVLNDHAPQNQPPYGTAPLTYPSTDPAGTSLVWGANQPQDSNGKIRWTRRNTAVAIGVAVVVAGGGAVAVHAAGSGSAGAATQLAGAQGMPGVDGTGAGTGATTGAAGLVSAVHGEYVVLQNGKYVTMITQTGQITAVSSTAVTIKSADGVSLSYVLGSATAVSTSSALSTAGSLQSAQGGPTGQGGPPGAASSGTGTSGSASQGSISDLATGKTVRITALKGSSGNSAESVVVSTAAATG